jgi:hypothetical protein
MLTKENHMCDPSLIDDVIGGCVDQVGEQAPEDRLMQVRPRERSGRCR